MIELEIGMFIKNIHEDYKRHSDQIGMIYKIIEYDSFHKPLNDEVHILWYKRDKVGNLKDWFSRAYVEDSLRRGLWIIL